MIIIIVNNNDNNNDVYLAVLVLYEVTFLQLDGLTDVSRDLLGNVLAVLVLYEVAFLQLSSLTNVPWDLSGNVLATLGGDSSADSSGHLGAPVTAH